MLRKKDLIMNLTPLLDLIIILFFAQSLQLSSRSHVIESKAIDLEEEYALVQLELEERNLKLSELKAELENKKQLSNDLEFLKIAREKKDREISELLERLGLREEELEILQNELEKRNSDLKFSREELLAREEAYLQAFSKLIDPGMFMEIVLHYMNKEEIAEIDGKSRELTTIKIARYFIEQKKQSEAFRNHVTLWSFYLRLNPATEKYEVNFRINDVDVPFSREEWDFSSPEAVSKRLEKELLDNKIPNPSKLLVPIWWTLGDVYYEGRETFATALKDSLKRINDTYRLEVDEGGRGLSELRIVSGNIHFGGNIMEIPKDDNKS